MTYVQHIEHFVYSLTENYPELMNWLADNNLTEGIYDAIMWWYPVL